jgi:hypothetical protein
MRIDLSLKIASLKLRIKWKMSYLQIRYSYAWSLRVYLSRLFSKLSNKIDELKFELRATVLREARLFLCTIHTVKNLCSVYQKTTESPIKIHTVFVDEAGCVTESCIPLLLLCNPVNIVLVGDHKQLPPFTKFRQDEVVATRYGRSAFERIADARNNLPLLTTQYRMHPTICNVVDQLFYGSRLTTAPELSRPEPVAMFWVHTNSPECDVGKSFKNEEEIEAVKSTCEWLLTNRPDYGILVMTFYEVQLRALVSSIWGDDRKPFLRKVRIQTVDAAQGQQDDVVILSCVRNNPYTIGFTANRNRMCVALSRAKHMLVTVGNVPTFLRSDDWKVVVESSCPVLFQQGSVMQLLPQYPLLSDGLIQRLCIDLATSCGSVQASRVKATVTRMARESHPLVPTLAQFGWNGTAFNELSRQLLKDLFAEFLRYEHAQHARISHLQEALDLLGIIAPTQQLPLDPTDEFDFM